MKKYRNVGHHERVIRVGVGFLLLALSGFSLLPGWGDLAFMILGIIALLTGIIGYCPAWQIIGINTCPTQKSEQSPSTAQPSVHEHADPPAHRS